VYLDRILNDTPRSQFILQASTQVLAIAIDGKLMPPDSKQTRLYDRYRQRLKDVKDGKAMLGTK